MTRRTLAQLRLAVRAALVRLELAARLTVAAGLGLLLIEVVLRLTEVEPGHNPSVIAPAGALVTVGLAGMVAVPTARALHRWWTGESAIVRRIYRHVDEVLGARRFEADRTATLRRRAAFVSKDLAALLWPGAQPSGTIALPRQGRMRRYVQVEFEGTRPWWRRWQLWQVRSVTLWWTSEANALGDGFVALLGRRVAQALRLKRSDQLEPDPKPESGYVVYARRKPGTPARGDVPYAEVPDV